jgi:hypothetical protein
MPCKATTKVEKLKLQKAKEACIKAKDIWNKNTCTCTKSSNHKETRMGTKKLSQKAY